MIESILSDTRALELFVVKDDIEGFETGLFSANTGWIDRAEVVMIEPHDRTMPDRGTSSAFPCVMGTSGLELHISGENRRPPSRTGRGRPGGDRTDPDSRNPTPMLVRTRRRG